MVVSGQLHASATLLSGKYLQYQLDRRLAWSQSLSRCCGDEKNPFLLLGIIARFLALSTRSLVAAPTDLSWLVIG
jgi:hypothetical protein